MIKNKTGHQGKSFMTMTRGHRRARSSLADKINLNLKKGELGVFSASKKSTGKPLLTLRTREILNENIHSEEVLKPPKQNSRRARNGQTRAYLVQNQKTRF
jgi:hypothetical protein